MSRFSFTAFLLVVSGGAFAAGSLMKLFFRLGPPLPGPAAPVYALGIGVFVLVMALSDRSSRGLVFTALGAVVSTAAAIAVIPITSATVLVWAAGVPLIIPGSVGLAAFAHGYLHGNPAVGDRGLQLVGVAAVASFGAVVYVAIVVLIRGVVHDTPTGTSLVAMGVVIGLIVMGAGFMRGRRESR